MILRLATTVLLTSAFRPCSLQSFRPRMSSMSCASSSFASFLKQATATPAANSKNQHIVIGNPAGDADSIISALSLAYVDHLAGVSPKYPIVSVPRADLALRRETMLLLEMIQIDASTCLTYLDDLEDSGAQQVTLVDHNKLVYDVLKGAQVMEILDHHFDELFHPEVQGDLRNIGFRDSSALVGSTCTLVAERLLLRDSANIPADLAFALMSVILLDTVNMSPAAGKGTVRDKAALASLAGKADWASFMGSNEKVKQFFTTGPHVVLDTDMLFGFLNESKFDLQYWKSLSTQDALRLDYKQFETSRNVFGASSILFPISDLLQRPAWEKEIMEYLTSTKISILIILSMVIVNGAPRRNMLLCGTDKYLLEKMATFLQASNILELKEHGVTSTSDEFTVRHYSQGNPKASRKQVVPIVLDFYAKL